MVVTWFRFLLIVALDFEAPSLSIHLPTPVYGKQLLFPLIRDRNYFRRYVTICKYGLLLWRKELLMIPKDSYPSYHHPASISARIP
jgi:hypothetical protein